VNSTTSHQLSRQTRRNLTNFVLASKSSTRKSPQSIFSLTLQRLNSPSSTRNTPRRVKHSTTSSLKRNDWLLNSRPQSRRRQSCTKHSKHSRKPTNSTNTNSSSSANKPVKTHPRPVAKKRSSLKPKPNSKRQMSQHLARKSPNAPLLPCSSAP
jgi:hypothetical protein